MTYDDLLMLKAIDNDPDYHEFISEKDIDLGRLTSPHVCGKWTEMTYDDLLIESDSNDLITKEKCLPLSKGRIKGNRIAIRKNMTEREKKCVLAEELGHYYTTVGDIIDQSDTGNRKQEYRARLIAYDRLIGLVGIVDAYKHGCRSRYEIAEHLDVTEAFLQETLEAYRSKYGLCTQLADYIIYFDPLGVLELNV